MRLLLVLSLTLAGVHAQGVEPQVKITYPVLNNYEKRILRPVNSDVQFACTVQYKPQESKVRWQKADLDSGPNDFAHVISSDEESYDSFYYRVYKPDNNVWQLNLYRVSLDKSGKYQCIVKIDNWRYYVDYIELEIYEVPHFMYSLTTASMEKRDGQEVTLNCHARGTPEPQIIWTRQDRGALPTGTTSQTGNTLEFIASPKTRGVYVCTAQNQYKLGTVSRNIPVIVDYEPYIEFQEPNVYQTTGYMQEMFCYIYAHPVVDASRVGWSKEGGSSQTLDEDSRYEVKFTRFSGDKATLRLRIWSVSAGDFGTYTCSASRSDGGTSKASSELIESDTPVKVPTFDMAVEGKGAASQFFVSIVLLTLLYF